MAKSEVAVCVLGIIACFCLHISDATLCKPNSKFKFDCNTCSCSSTGREFSCTNTICAQTIYKDKYLIEQNEKGYSILKPKPNSLDVDKKRSVDDDDDDLFLNDRPISGKFKRNFITSPYGRRLQRPIGKLIESSEDYVDYDNQNLPSIEADIQDDDDSNESDNDYNDSDEDLVTYGKEEPPNMLY